MVLNGWHPSGSPIQFGGFGIGTTRPCSPENRPATYMYPGDPVTSSYWSMEKLTPDDTCQLDTFDGMRRSDVAAMLLSVNSPTIQPGKSVSFDFAVTWARGRDRHDSILKLRDHADVIRENSAVLLNPTVEALAPEDQIPGDLLFTMYPNPTAAQLSIKYSIPSPARIRIRVFDVLGRIRAEPVSAMQQPGTHSVQLDVSAWAPGAYFIRYELTSRTFTRRLVVI